jgi:hypothetical protein
MVDQTVMDLKGKTVEVFLAVGGGSVLDPGKAIAAMLRENGSVVDFLEGVGKRTPSGESVPVVAVPTTSGTGSEATKNAVISRVGRGGFYKSLWHDDVLSPTIIPRMGQQQMKNKMISMCHEDFPRLKKQKPYSLEEERAFVFTVGKDEIGLLYIMFLDAIAKSECCKQRFYGYLHTISRRGINCRYSMISRTVRFLTFEETAPRMVRMAWAVRPCLPITFPKSSLATVSSKTVV